LAPSSFTPSHGSTPRPVDSTTVPAPAAPPATSAPEPPPAPPPEPERIPEPTTAPPPPPLPEPERTSEPTIAPPAPSNVVYKNCAAARAAGAAPLYAGEPGYSSTLDRDGDGVACE